jgi:hypothetical protein
VSHGLGSRLLAEVSSDVATCPTAQCFAFLRGELRCGAATCPTSPGGLWTPEIKKGLAALGTQLGSRVFKAHSCVTEAPADVHAATMRLYNAASAALGTQLGSRVFKAHLCVTEAPADVHAATMRLYNAASTQLTTPGHGYRGDTTRQDGTTVHAMFSTAER